MHPLIKAVTVVDVQLHCETLSTIVVMITEFLTIRIFKRLFCRAACASVAFCIGR